MAKFNVGSAGVGFLAGIAIVAIILGILYGTKSWFFSEEPEGEPEGEPCPPPVTCPDTEMATLTDDSNAKVILDSINYTYNNTTNNLFKSTVLVDKINDITEGIDLAPIAPIATEFASCVSDNVINNLVLNNGNVESMSGSEIFDIQNCINNVAEDDDKISKIRGTLVDVCNKPELVARLVGTYPAADPTVANEPEGNFGDDICNAAINNTDEEFKQLFINSM